MSNFLSFLSDRQISKSDYRISAFGNESQTCRVGEQFASPVASHSVAFAGLVHRRPNEIRLRVKLPLNLRVERDDDGTFIVSDSLFGIYGEGFDSEAAFLDYQSALTDYFLLLYDHREASAEDGKVYDAVSQLIEVVPQPRITFF
jgi:hypothetical protein